MLPAGWRWPPTVFVASVQTDERGFTLTSAETRLALARKGVRRQLWSAWLGGALVWSGLVEGPWAIGRAGGPRSALVPAGVFTLALMAGLIGRSTRSRPHTSLLAAAGPLLLAGLTASPVVLAVGVVIGAVAGGWSVGAASAVASMVVDRRAAAAASGLILVTAGAGLVLLPLSPLWLCALVLALTAVTIEFGALPRPPASVQSAAIHPGELSARSVTHAFGERLVINGVDLRLRSGELVVLAGGNGSGKSTLLRILGGHIVPDEGDVFLGNRSLLGSPPEELARNGVFLISGSRPVFFDLTVEENLRLGRWLAVGDRGSPMDAALSHFPELRDLMHQPAGTLSGGEQRLVALAQSLMVRPVVVLADEVTLGLSPEARARALAVLRKLADDGAAVLVVDHQLSDLIPMADRTLVLAEGTVRDAPADSGEARFIRMAP